MIFDEPIPVECGKCAPSTATGARPKFTDTPDGRRAHARVFGHMPDHVHHDPNGATR
ncbi:hypothetical protein HF998_02635 [Cellulomonas hominis]|uniref:hypothetical protein n=1 Tax=Cellulomonas hominis TaxID=156981 RepID=UPI00161A08F7|nr:hypothetical protein [Cellulomonas hominis]NKY05884.1 hypothetical protein [Cellulomonas hominis]